MSTMDRRRRHTAAMGGGAIPGPLQVNIAMLWNSFGLPTDTYLPVNDDISGTPHPPPSQILLGLQALPPPVGLTFHSAGHGGATVADLTADIPTDIDPFWLAGHRNLYGLQEQINTLAVGMVPTAQAAIDQTKINAGATAMPWDVLVGAPTPRNNPQVGFVGPWPAGVSKSIPGSQTVTTNQTTLGQVVYVAVDPSGLTFSWSINGIAQTALPIAPTVALPGTGGMVLTFPAGTYTGSPQYFITAGYEAERQQWLSIAPGQLAGYVAPNGSRILGIVPMPPPMGDPGAYANDYLFANHNTNANDKFVHPTAYGAAWIAAKWQEGICDLLGWPVNACASPYANPYNSAARGAQTGAGHTPAANGNPVSRLLHVVCNDGDPYWDQPTGAQQMTYDTTGSNPRLLIDPTKRMTSGLLFMTLGGTYIFVEDISAGGILENSAGATVVDNRIYLDDGATQITTYQYAPVTNLGTLKYAAAGSIVNTTKQLVVFVVNGTDASNKGWKWSGGALVPLTLATAAGRNQNPGLTAIQKIARTFNGTSGGATGRIYMRLQTPVAMDGDFAFLTRICAALAAEYGL